MQESIAFLVRVQCRRKESLRSLSHLLMSFLYCIVLYCYSRIWSTLLLNFFENLYLESCSSCRAVTVLLNDAAKVWS